MSQEHNFCIFCGRKRQKVNDKVEQGKSEPTQSLSSFLDEKKDERQSRFTTKKRKASSSYSTSSTPKQRRDDFVTISIGLVKFGEKGMLQKIRGSRLPIKVEKNMTADKVLEIAKRKHSDHDQYFCYLEDYTMVYPDNREVVFIPGTNQQFTVSDYKKELGKPYSKIDLYLCLSHDLVEENRTNDDDNDASSNEKRYEHVADFPDFGLYVS